MVMHRNVRCFEAHQPEFAVEVVTERFTLSDAMCELVVVVRVDVMTDCDVFWLSAVEISVLCDVSLLLAVVVRVEMTTELLTALESAVEVRTESLTAFESAVDACVPAETAREFAAAASTLDTSPTTNHVPSYWVCRMQDVAPSLLIDVVKTPAFPLIVTLFPDVSAGSRTNST